MQEASGDVVVEVGEAEGDAAQVFEPAVDGFGGPVAGELVVEVGQDVRQAAFEGARQGHQFAGRVGGACVDAVGRARASCRAPCVGRVRRSRR